MPGARPPRAGEYARVTIGRPVALVSYPRLAPMSASTIPLAVPAPPATDVLGTQVALVDYDAVMDWMDAMVSARQRGFVCVAAVHPVMAAREDPDLRAALRTASLTVPDGQPVV